MTIRFFIKPLIVGVWIFAAIAAAGEDEVMNCHGGVVDVNGNGIEDALIIIYKVESGDTSLFGYGLRIVGRTKSGADGRFTSQIKNEVVGSYGVVIVAAKMGYAIGWDWLGPGDDADVSITLGRGAVLAGEVVDDKGNGVGGAEVRAFLFSGVGEEGSILTGNSMFNGLVVETDENGLFSFPSIPVDVRAEFFVKAPGRAHVFTLFETMETGRERLPRYLPGQKDIQIYCPLESVIEGRVIEAGNKKGAVGVGLVVYGMMGVGVFGENSCVSGDDGVFRISGLRAGLYELRLAEKQGELPEWVAEKVDVSVEAGKKKSGVIIEVGKGSVVEVAVVDKSDGSAIEGAHVGLASTDIDVYKAAYGQTGKDGVARFRVVPGEYALTMVVKDGYKIPDYEQRKVTLTHGRREQLRLELAKLPIIEGIVRDETGKAVGGAMVDVLPGWGSKETGKDGKFKFSYDISEKLGGWIFARHAEKNLSGLEEITSGQSKAELVVKAGLTINGQVVDANGVGAENVSVRASILLEDQELSLNARVRGDGQGRYEISGLVAGHSYKISAVSVFDSGDIDVTVDDKLLKYNARAIKLGVIQVSGEVVDEEGEGIAGATVLIYDTQKNKTSLLDDVKLAGHVTTDLNGKYIIERRKAQRKTNSGFVIARAEGYSIGWVHQWPGNEKVGKIRLLSRPKIFTGQVVDGNGAAVMGARVCAFVSCEEYEFRSSEVKFAVANSKLLSTVTDEHGGFEFFDIPRDAKGEFGVFAEGYPKTFTWKTEKGLDEMQYEAGQKDIRIVLSRVGSISGRLVQNSTDQTIEGVKVFIVRNRGNGSVLVAWHFKRGTMLLETAEKDSRAVISGVDGSFQAHGLMAGNYSVFLDPFNNSDRKWTSAKEEVFVEPGEPASVILRAFKPGFVNVHVTNAADGSSMQSASVNLKAVAGERDFVTENDMSRVMVTGTVSFVSNDSVFGEGQVLSVYNRGLSEKLLPVRTDENGIASFNLRPDVYVVGSIAMKDYVLIEKDLSINVKEDETEEIEIQLRYKAGIYGICTDEAGVPVAGAAIRAFGMTKSISTTDSDGKFQLVPESWEELKNKDSFYIIAEQSHLGLCGIASIYTHTKEEVSVVLEQGKWISGRLVGGGEVLSKGQVTVFLGRGRWMEMLHGQRLEKYCAVLPDSQGEFVIGPVVSKFNYLLSAEVEGYGKIEKIVNQMVPNAERQFENNEIPGYRGEARPKGVETVRMSGLRSDKDAVEIIKMWRFTSDKDTVEVGDFVFKTANLSISGIFVDMEGYPVPGMKVSVSGPKQSPQELTALDKTGRFRFDGLCEGEVEVSFGMDEDVFSRDNIRVMAGDEQIRIIRTDVSTRRREKTAQAIPSASIKTLVVDTATGKPVKDVSVSIKQEHGNSVSMHVDDDGIARISVGAGRHELSAGKYPYYHHKTIEIVVENNESYQFVLELERKLEAFGRVVDSDGNPVNKATLECFPDSSFHKLETTTDGEFEFRWKKNDNNEKTVSYLVVYAQERTLGTIVEIMPQREIGDIVAEPTATLVLNVKDDRANFAPMVLVTLYGPKWNYPPEIIKPTSKGLYEIKGLIPPLPGHYYEVRISGSRGKKFKIESGQIETGKVKTMDIILK